jgi:hypothetical protein
MLARRDQRLHRPPRLAPCPGMRSATVFSCVHRRAPLR